MKNLMSWRWTPQPLNGVSMEVLRSEGVVPNGRQLIEARLDAAKSLYRRDLLCHYGCVNALEFSRDGQLLVSG